MAKGNKSGGQQQQATGGNSLQHVSFDPRSGHEEQALRQLEGLGNNQTSFLSGLMAPGGGPSPFQLNPQDRAELDKSYQSAFDRFNLEGKDYADYLATTRGLNKSDSPVSEQAMMRYGLGMGDLLSQKANMGLNMGLQGTNLRMQGTQMIPAGLQSMLGTRMQERLAAPTTMTNQSGTMSGSNSYTPSPLTTIGQGLGVMSQGLGMASGMGSMFSPTGTAAGGIGMGLRGGGMGSGAAANPTLGNYGSWSNGRW